MIKIAFYLRVSREDADSRTGVIPESYSITNQRNLLYQFITSQPQFEDSAVIEICDDGFSGTNMERPGMIKLLELAQAKKVDCIIFKDFSRFARNYLDLNDYVEQVFPSLGIRVISVNDNYDNIQSASLTNHLDVELRSIFDAYYSADLSQKIRSGKNALALKGAYISPYAPFGYKKDPKDKHRLIVDEDCAGIVQRIFNLACSGMSTNEIAKLFNAEKIPTRSVLKRQQGVLRKSWEGKKDLWKGSMIREILINERYLGKAIFNKRSRYQIGMNRTVRNDRADWIVIENAYEPLITVDIFMKAQENLRRYQKNNNIKRQIHLFTKKLYCGKCGYLLRRSKRNKESDAIKYYCDTIRSMTEQFGCMAGFIMESRIEEVVLAAIQMYIKGFMDKQKLAIKGDGDTKELQKQLDAYKVSMAYAEERKTELYEAYVDNKLGREQFIAQKDKIRTDQIQFREQIGELEKRIADMERERTSVKDDKKRLEDYYQCTTLTRAMVEEFVDRIDVYSENHIEIKWKFSGESDSYNLN